jgi:hypothetical protein
MPQPLKSTPLPKWGVSKVLVNWLYNALNSLRILMQLNRKIMLYSEGTRVSFYQKRSKSRA